MGRWRTVAQPPQDHFMRANLLTEKRTFFRPKLVDCLRGYTSAQFFADLAAGLTVGIVALPLAMAFAIAATRANAPVTVLGASSVEVSYPQFFETLSHITAP